MKLKTKFEDEDFRLGEICAAAITTGRDGYIKVEAPCNDGGWHEFYYKSLEEVLDKWEDYEDELFYIVSAEHKDGYICALKEDYKELCDIAKKLGIGFETEEEAEKAVEKLKAFNRLKDKGFRFIGKTYETDKRFGSIFYKVDEDTYSEDIIDALDICFGGKE